MARISVARQWCRASGLRHDLLQCHNTRTEGVAITVGDVVQFADQRFGLHVVFAALLLTRRQLEHSRALPPAFLQFAEGQVVKVRQVFDILGSFLIEVG